MSSCVSLASFNFVLDIIQNKEDQTTQKSIKNKVMSHYQQPLAFSLDIYILYKWARVRHVVFSEWTPFFFSFSYFSPSFGPSPASAQAASSCLRCAAAPLHTYETACKHTRSPVLFALQKMSYLYTFLHLAFLLIKCGENVLTSLIFFFYYSVPKFIQHSPFMALRSCSFFIFTSF